MRIAIYHNLPSGGAKRTLYEATKRLASAHTIDVFTVSSANHEFADIRPFVNHYHVYPFQSWPLLNSPFGRLNQLIRLADLVRLRRMVHHIAAAIEQERYDVLLVHPCQFEKAPSVLSFMQRVPTVYYCHESLRQLYEKTPSRPYDDAASPRRQLLNRVDPLPGLYYRVLKRTDWRNIHHATQVLVNSQFTQQMIRQIYGLETAVSYHGIDVAQFRPIAVAPWPILLSVGSLTPMKGFDFLIEAMSHVPRAQRLPLVIVSNFQNPPEKQYLHQLAQAKEVELQLLDNVTDQHLITLYNQAVITLYAPIQEPFGMVPLEAMACQTPVIAVREGGIQETVVHEKTGLLVERDPQKFADAISQMLADPDLAMAYGHAGRQHVIQNWTWGRSVETLSTHLHEVAKARQKTPH